MSIIPLAIPETAKSSTAAVLQQILQFPRSRLLKEDHIEIGYKKVLKYQAVGICLNSKFEARFSLYLSVFYDLSDNSIYLMQIF